MTVLRTDRKHASNCMTEENGVEKVKKRKNFFRSLRFRILIILIILGIVPGVIVTIRTGRLQCLQRQWVISAIFYVI
jgi:hypothetical protein